MDIHDLELLVDACHCDISLEIEVVFPVAVKSTENVHQISLGKLVAGASASWNYVQIRGIDGSDLKESMRGFPIGRKDEICDGWIILCMKKAAGES